jgi:hypothetical protein
VIFFGRREWRETELAPASPDRDDTAPGAWK